MEVKQLNSTSASCFLPTANNNTMKTQLLLLALLISNISNAQDMLGLSNGNYAGNAGMAMNPTSMVLMPYKWEVSLVSFNISLENNYLGLPRNKIIGRTEANSFEPLGGLKEFYSSSSKAANLHLGVGLPSFIYRFNDMAIGFHMTVRNDISVHNLSSDLAILAYKGTDYKSIQGKDIVVDDEAGNVLDHS